MRIVRDPGRSVEAELPAGHLTVANVPLVVADGTPFAQMENFYVAYTTKNQKKKKSIFSKVYVHIILYLYSKKYCENLIRLTYLNNSNGKIRNSKLLNKCFKNVYGITLNYT